jgi:transcriptional regulator with XRE-family HTH domain
MQRNAKGLTQERLAELSEFHPTYVSLLEHGKEPTVPDPMHDR